MTKIIKVNKWNPEAEIISEASEIIKSGGLVAFPTETVYGLGGNALNSDAVKKIFLAKGRPSDNPLILHVSNKNQVESLVYLNDIAEKLILNFWPGPLTIVLRAKDIIPVETRGGLRTAALRMPDNPVALALIEKSGVPLAAPSANLSGRPSPTDSESVFNDMNGKIDLILDGGDVDVGIESTVIDLSSENSEKVFLLRPGGMPVEIIEEFLKIKLSVPDYESKKRSPGTRYRHYAPEIPVIIWEKNKKEEIENILKLKNESLGFMGLHSPPENLNFKSVIIFNSIENYARGLFSGFRNFEKEGIQIVVAEWPSGEGIGLGLRDRISRAAGAN